MQVTLPNGTVIRGIPEGTHRLAVMEKAISAGLATQEDFGEVGERYSPVSESKLARLGQGIKSGVRKRRAGRWAIARIELSTRVLLFVRLCVFLGYSAARSMESEGRTFDFGTQSSRRTPRKSREKHARGAVDDGASSTRCALWFVSSNRYDR